MNQPPVPAVRRTPATRVAKVLLLLVMAVGSLAMWIAVPIGCVWLASRLGNHYLFVYGVALVACPMIMGLVGVLLYRLNALYLRLSGMDQATSPRAAWLKSVSGERGSTRQRTPLDLFMTASVIIAVVLLLVYFFFLSGSPLSPYN